MNTKKVKKNTNTKNHKCVQKNSDLKVSKIKLSEYLITQMVKLKILNVSTRYIIKHFYS